MFFSVIFKVYVNLPEPNMPNHCTTEAMPCHPFSWRIPCSRPRQGQSRPCGAVQLRGRAPRVEETSKAQGKGTDGDIGDLELVGKWWGSPYLTKKKYEKNWTIKHLVILSIKHGGLDLQNWWVRDWFKLRSRLGRNSSRTASYFGVSYRMDKEHKLRTRVGLSQINSGIQKIRPHVGRMFWSWITMFSFDDKCPQIPKFLPLY